MHGDAGYHKLSPWEPHEFNIMMMEQCCGDHRFINIGHLENSVLKK